MQAIREIVNRDTFKNFEIPKEFGDRFEMILLPIENEEVGKIENGKLRMENENRGYFEIEDKNGISHKIPNWTEDEFKELGLRSFFGEYNDDKKENEQFLAAIYNAVIEDNKKEDQIWMKYQEESGFCKNVLADESEDVWNDV